MLRWYSRKVVDLLPQWDLVLDFVSFSNFRKNLLFVDSPLYPVFLCALDFWTEECGLEQVWAVTMVVALGDERAFQHVELLLCSGTSFCLFLFHLLFSNDEILNLLICRIRFESGFDICSCLFTREISKFTFPFCLIIINGSFQRKLNFPATYGAFIKTKSPLFNAINFLPSSS